MLLQQLALTIETTKVVRPVFDNLSPGFYTAYVRDQVCGEISLDVTVLGFPKFFTPNGDGQNDTWQIKGFESNNGITIHIFDRFGKLLKTLSTASAGCDGVYNGNLLPTSDYWFTITFEDGREYTDHFSLKR